MNLFPSKFNIGGVKYSVEEPIQEDRNKLGTASSVKSTIVVPTKVVEYGSDKFQSLSQDIRNETFFHELIHIIFDHTLDIELTEAQVKASSVLLHQFVKENYELKNDLITEYYTTIQ